MIGDYNTTSSGGLFLVNTVFDAETSGLDGIVQDSSVFVIADSSKEYDAVGWENVLGSTSGVLGAASGNQFGGVVVEEVFVDWDVLFLGEDRVIGFETVFFEEGLVSLGLDIWGKRLIQVFRKHLLRGWTVRQARVKIFASPILHCSRAWKIFPFPNLLSCVLCARD